MSHIIDKILNKVLKGKKRIKYLKKKGVKIGENCEINKAVNFGSEPYLIKIGNNVRITEGCKFITHDGGAWVLRNMKLLENADIFGNIQIGDNVHIGMNSIIMPGVKIGNNCIIGCGAVVTKDVYDNSIVGGVPARYIKSISDYYEKHKNTCDYTKNLTKDEKRNYLYNKYNLND